MTNGTKGSSTSGEDHLSFLELQGNTEPHAAWDVGYSGARQRWYGISLSGGTVRMKTRFAWCATGHPWGAIGSR